MHRNTSASKNTATFMEHFTGHFKTVRINFSPGGLELLYGKIVIVK